MQNLLLEAYFGGLTLFHSYCSVNFENKIQFFVNILIFIVGKKFRTKNRGYRQSLVADFWATSDNLLLGAKCWVALKFIDRKRQQVSSTSDV